MTSCDVKTEYDVISPHTFTFLKKCPVLKFFSIKFPIEWAIVELSTMILKICKKWHFNGKLKIKIVFAPIEKIKFFEIFFHRTSFDGKDRRFLPNLGYISFNLTVLFKKNLWKLQKIEKRPYKRRLRFFLHG